MTLSTHGTAIADTWNEFAESSSPAGALFISGVHTEADIVGRTTTGSGKCGTVCSGSGIRQCC